MPNNRISAQLAYPHTEYLDQLYNRFYEGEERSFLGEDFDWSGIGRRDSDTGWATSVTDHFFISAQHYHPKVGDVIKFWPKNDHDEYITRTVVWGTFLERVGAQYLADCWIGMLDQPLPPEYKRYPFYVRDNPNYNSVEHLIEYRKPFVFYVGQRPSSVGGKGFAVGVAKVYIMRHDASTYTLENYTQYTEDTNAVYGVGGDSAAPSLAVVGGELAILGTHYSSTKDGFAAMFTDKINGVIASAPSNNTERVSTVDGYDVNIEIDKNSRQTSVIKWDNTTADIYSLQSSLDLIDWQTVYSCTGYINKGWSWTPPPLISEPTERFFRVILHTK